MRLSHATGNPEYARLRAEYDAAFENLTIEFHKLQPAPPGSPALHQRFHEAVRVYHERRDRLAEFLVSKPSPSKDTINILAYQLWEQAGRPAGQSDQYWYQAESQLRHTA